MAARLTLKTVNDELARRGAPRAIKAGDYFYFWSGDAANWIDRTVRVPKANSLTMDQWVDEFLKLKKLNRQIMETAKGRAKAVPRTKQTRP